MLFIKLTNNSVKNHKVGDSIGKWSISIIDSITATDKELEFIRNEFKNIPDCANNDCMTWEGEMARFIIGNLRW